MALLRFLCSLLSRRSSSIVCSAAARSACSAGSRLISRPSARTKERGSGSRLVAAALTRDPASDLPALAEPRAFALFAFAIKGCILICARLLMASPSLWIALEA